MFFPETSLNIANLSYGFPYQTPLSLPATEELVKPAADAVDPDVTQLDIEPTSMPLNTVKTQKRQLIVGEGESIEHNIWSQIRINYDEDDEYGV